MKRIPIIHRYIFGEMVPPFSINVLFFTFVFLMTKILDITNLVVNYRISLLSVFLMLVYSMPFFLVFVIPMSVMMTVLLTFLRMSSDNEIIALKAGGVSLYRLLAPVLAFAFLGCLLTGFMGIYGLPWGKRSMKALTLHAATANLDVGLKERTFIDTFAGVMLYINEVEPQSRELLDVFIEDQRKEESVSAVVAPRGRLLSDPQNMRYRLRLYDGIINQVTPETRSVHSIRFDTYDIALDLKKAVVSQQSKTRDEKEMSLSEMRQYLDTETEKDAHYYITLIEYHKKFAMPFACFALGILSLPLGVQARSAKRSFGLGLGLVFFLMYYLIHSAGWVFGEMGAYPPVLGMWMPNIVMGGIGVFLLVRTANEKPVGLQTMLNLSRRVLAYLTETLRRFRSARDRRRS
ncbi:MAG: LPS export ABC transporter permease LptF [Desulfobacteraceae bacterium]|nr:LPS export ABC transporter permease LptF [Desulfobacteraceae bacterium]